MQGRTIGACFTLVTFTSVKYGKTVAKLNSTEMYFWRRSTRVSRKEILGIILLNKK
jgi:hypothetical protein